MARRLNLALTMLYAVALALVSALPASAHSGYHGSRYPFGEVTSFDGTTLVVTSLKGESYSFPVSDELQVKVEHRGHKAHGKGFKKPSNGSVEDLLPGAKVMRMKIVCGEVTKIRLRRAPAPETVSGAVSMLTEGSDDSDSEDDSDECDDEESDSDEDNSGSDSGSGDSGDDNDGEVTETPDGDDPDASLPDDDDDADEDWDVLDPLL